jgi:hypothetical protein
MHYGILVQFLARVRRPERLASKVSEIRATLGVVCRESVGREEKAKNSRDEKSNWFHDPALINFSKIFWLTNILGNCTDFLANDPFTVARLELKEWIGKRAEGGRLPPKGFPKTNRAEG